VFVHPMVKSMTVNVLRGKVCLCLFVSSIVLLTACSSPVPDAAIVPQEKRRVVMHGSRSGIRLLHEPRSIKNASTDKSGFTRQIFSWSSYGGEWRLLPLLCAGYGGFEFRRPMCLEPNRTSTALRFRLKPWERDADICLAMLDGNGRMSSIEISDYRLRSWNGWGIYALRLDEFPDDGSMVDENGGKQPEAPVDWKHIVGIRLISSADVAYIEPIRIRDLRLVPLVVEKQK